MLKFLLLLLTPAASKAQAQQDSLLIYNAYKSNIEILVQEKDYQRWSLLQDSLDRATACAFRRLSLYNKEEYKPSRNYEREGFGEAYYFPAPTGLHETVSLPVSHGAPAFSIVSHQTKFITRDDGKTRIPYIERLYFDGAHRLMKVEKIDPAKFDADDLYVSVE